MDFDEHSDADSDVAPPSDEDFDIIPDHLSDEGEGDAPTAAAAARKDGVESAVKDGGKGGPGVGELTKRRARGSLIFAPTPDARFADGGTGAKGSGKKGQDPDNAMETIYVPQDVHEVSQALKYRMLMQPKPIPLSQQDDAHITAMVSSYFVSHGFHRSATALRNSTTTRNTLASKYSDGQLAPSRADSNAIVSDTARKVGLLFDDDSAWPTDNMTFTDIPLQVIDTHSGATGGTLETIIEKLIFDDSSFSVTDRGEPTVVDFSKVTFVSVFLVMSSSFVSPDALLSKLAKLFKSVAGQHLLLGEVRRVVLLKRILNFLLKWVSCSAIDFRRVVVERLVSFASSIIRSGGHHFEVVQQATALLQAVQLILDAPNVVASAQPAPLVPIMSVETVTATVPSDKEVTKITDCPDVELARQLSLMHYDLMAQVRPRELLNAAWTEPPLKAICTRLNAFVEFAGEVTQWFASLIVAASDITERKTIYSKCIRLSHLLYNMQNHFLAKALQAACDHSAVVPLVDSSMLTGQELESSDALRAALDLSKVAKKELPLSLVTACIPHASVYLSQMSRTHETAKTKILASGNVALINWSKMLTMGRVILSFISLQSVPYPYQFLPHYQRFLQQMPGRRVEESLMALSKQKQDGRG